MARSTTSDRTRTGDCNTVLQGWAGSWPSTDPGSGRSEVEGPWDQTVGPLPLTKFRISTMTKITTKT